MRRIARFTCACLATLAFCITAHAQTPQIGPSQSPATNAVDAGYATQQQQRQLTQPLNNQPVWSEARSGSPQFTSIPGRETNILIQPEGQTWRALRNSQVSVYAGWGLVLMVIARLGRIPPADGAVCQEVSDVAAILNARRAR